ncbi:hypothetical protein C8J57DRAFT_1215958 [Mycena rebaudengoi]|nr:hypothetical protein C8J57DRAFT_1215958 [Mycena rebaudengoi]
MWLVQGRRAEPLEERPEHQLRQASGQQGKCVPAQPFRPVPLLTAEFSDPVWADRINGKMAPVPVVSDPFTDCNHVTESGYSDLQTRDLRAHPLMLGLFLGGEHLNKSVSFTSNFWMLRVFVLDLMGTCENPYTLEDTSPVHWPREPQQDSHRQARLQMWGQAASLAALVIDVDRLDDGVSVQVHGTSINTACRGGARGAVLKAEIADALRTLADPPVIPAPNAAPPPAVVNAHAPAVPAPNIPAVPAPNVAATRLRTARVHHLTEEDLWVGGDGPSEQLPTQKYHGCSISTMVKSHLVSYIIFLHKNMFANFLVLSYACGHSHCYVCIWVWLEKSWNCPECMTPMCLPPFRHYAEEHSLADAYPEWEDRSCVNYSWDGLVFPATWKIATYLFFNIVYSSIILRYGLFFNIFRILATLHFGITCEIRAEADSRMASSHKRKLKAPTLHAGVGHIAEGVINTVAKENSTLAPTAYVGEDWDTSTARQADDFTYELGNMGLEPEADDGEEDGIVLVEQERSRNSDRPWLTYIEGGYQQESLDEEMRRQGRGDEKIFLHCTGLKCKWDGTHWVKKHTLLGDLGLRVKLGHPAGAICPFKKAAAADFVLYDLSGGQKSVESNCNVFVGGLRLSLRFFQLVNCSGKLSAYDFIRGLEMCTNHDGLDPPLRLKRAGCGHIEDGVANIAQGQLRLDCRACPQLGWNLDEGWEKVPAFYKYIYFLFLAQDANFRLSNQNVSSEAVDPILYDGCGYFCNQVEYKAHIAKHVDEEEMSSCSGFQAMFLANAKRVKGLRTTGVAGVTCSRHNGWISLGNLQRGERQCNVDFIFLTSVLNFAMMYIILSYDIACQYGKKFWERMELMPTSMHLNIPHENLWWKVLNFHLPPHKWFCHSPYSFHFMWGTGMTHGEGVEQNWAFSNGAAASMKLMGPSSRQVTLEDISLWTMANITGQYFGGIWPVYFKTNVPDIYLQYTDLVYSKYTGLVYARYIVNKFWPNNEKGNRLAPTPACNGNKMTNSPLNLSCHLNIYFTGMTAFSTIIGGSVLEIVDKLRTSSPEDCNLLSTANHNKGTNTTEVNAALDLHKVFQYHKHSQADQQPETFAKLIGASVQVADLFATTGPFYVVYNGKTESAIYVRNLSDAEKQVLDCPHANAHWFWSIKDASGYMILQGDMNKIKALAFVPSNNTHGFEKSKLHQSGTQPIFSHIRDLSGIIDTIYGTNKIPEYPQHQIGWHASYYLHAHGYTASSIDEIASIWAHRKVLQPL